MPRTEVPSEQILDGDVRREDLNTTLVGQAVVRKVKVEGPPEISATFTGFDEGTGDVAIKFNRLKRVFTDEVITVNTNEVVELHSPILKGTSRIHVKGTGRVTI